MPHWDERRDRRWHRMKRADKLVREPENKALVDRFEADGDIVYWRQCCHELWKRLKAEIEEKATRHHEAT